MKNIPSFRIILVCTFLLNCNLSAIAQDSVSTQQKKPFERYGSGNYNYEVIILVALDSYAKTRIEKSESVPSIGFAIQPDCTLLILSPDIADESIRLRSIQENISDGLKSNKYLATGLCIVGFDKPSENDDRKERIIVFLNDTTGNQRFYIVPFYKENGSIRYDDGYFSKTVWNYKIDK
ncbi:MAG: hypothetical protein JXR46_13360 [Calditrichaceae bacterium]|nr:hypothetical protein [Calditrichaceae bacterium]MBN2710024.1 hypothetical protein [Calditrichaceae bacterium]RQV93672.1 MAG: hypothetical protein EH224_11955 [Calditrichota bacterium]